MINISQKMGSVAVILVSSSVVFAGQVEGKQVLELGAPFTNHAVLQRAMPVPVWGYSKPSTNITVEFAGQTKKATTDANGKWMLKLDPLKASADGRKLVVKSSDGEQQTLNDVLVGEVWLASGQSNMQWLASKCDVGQVLQKKIEERVEAGKEKAPVIREAKVMNYFAAPQPIERATVTWADAGAESSALGYAFAYKLHQELKVPIGILNCSFSQTAIQAWTPSQGFKGGKDDYTKAIYQKILESNPSTPEHKAAWSMFYQNTLDVLAENEKQMAKGKATKPVSEKTPGIMSSNRDATWLYNARTHPMVPYGIKGAIWNQGYANMGEGIVYYNNLHSLIRGWRELWKRPNLPVYFHQFYCPRQKGEWDHSPTIGNAAGMRMGTWLARDIPNTGMASQIDITGAIHYTNKTLPAWRLALHALKKQYGKGIEADGPMFRSYKVDGNKVIVELDQAKGGLVVGETGTNSKKNYALPKLLPDGDALVQCFYLAGEDKVWHPAKMKLDGEKIIVTSPKVEKPHGVSYGTGGVGNEPNVYNKSMLPMSPFIYFDNKLVTQNTWSDDKLKLAGQKEEDSGSRLRYLYRKLPLLSTQFRENAVLQADVPVTIWGSAVHPWGIDAEGKAVVKFSFAGVEKVIPVLEGMKEWHVTLPPMKASAKPHTLKVSLSIDGEVAHERTINGMVFGDVYYVAAPPYEHKFTVAENAKSSGIVRVLANKAKRSSYSKPSRYSVAVSTTPLNRFAASWEDASGFAAVLGHSVGKKSGNPVGIIFMQSKITKKKGSKPVDKADIKSWMNPVDLKNSPSWLADYKDLAVLRPGNAYYDKNVKLYLEQWKDYWAKYVPAIIETGEVPDKAAWGSYPRLTASISSEASATYNVYMSSFTPLAAKGIVFLSSEAMVDTDKGANFQAKMNVLVDSWRKRTKSEGVPFYSTVPNRELAPKLSDLVKKRKNAYNISISDWKSNEHLLKLVEVVTENASK